MIITRSPLRISLGGGGTDLPSYYKKHSGFLIAAAGPLIEVWMGKHYENAAYLVAVFALATQAHLLTGPGTSILKGIGRPKAELHYVIPNAIALLVTVPLSHAIVGAWTVPGIATATVAATLLSAAWFVVRANTILQVSAGEYTRFVLIPGLVPYLIAAPFALPAAYAVENFGRWVAFGILTVSGVLYSVALLMVVDRLVLETGERYWFYDVLRAKMGRFLPRRAATPVEENV